MCKRAEAVSRHLEIRGTTGGVFNADSNEVQTDCQDNKTRYEWREQEADFADHRSKREVEDATDNDRAKHSGHTVVGSNNHQNGYKREACALHNWQTCPDWAHTNSLEQRRNTCKKHRHLH